MVGRGAELPSNAEYFLGRMKEVVRIVIARAAHRGCGKVRRLS